MLATLIYNIYVFVFDKYIKIKMVKCI